MTREQRLVFGEDAALYDAARPSYPAALIRDVAALVGPGGNVADVGCGTGKATVLLAAAGLHGIGIEAHADMAAIARRHLEDNPHWRVDLSPFETWSPQPGDIPLDLITSAQAWHWIDPAVRFKRASELLRPGGWLALFWNRPANERVNEAMEAAYTKHAPDMAQRGMGINGRPVFEPAPEFDAPVMRGYEWTCEYTAQEWIDLLATQSDHRLLDAERRAALLHDVGSIIEADGGVYAHPYTCWLWAAQKPGQ